MLQWRSADVPRIACVLGGVSLMKKKGRAGYPGWLWLFRVYVSGM